MNKRVNNLAKERVNEDMLQLAREYRRISQSELARRVRVTQATISKIEAGITQEISADMLADIAEVLDFPSAFFTQDETATNIGSSSLYNRGRKKITVSDMKWIQAKVNLFRFQIKKLLAGVDTNIKRQLPVFDIENERNAESVARKLRSFWSLPDGPIKNISKIVESAGVIIIPCDFGTRHLDGTCLWLADTPPLIFVNSKLPADRYRWTICHELGHLVMHTAPRETQEDEADAFASEFLMPSDLLKFELRRKLSLQLFADLKSVWLVSMAALVRKAFDLNLMSDWQYRYYNINLRQLGVPEPNQFEKEKPSAWAELISYYTDELSFDASDFSKHQPAPDDFISTFPGLEKPKLSLVR